MAAHGKSDKCREASIAASGDKVALQDRSERNRAVLHAAVKERASLPLSYWEPVENLDDLFHGALARVAEFQQGER